MVGWLRMQKQFQVYKENTMNKGAFQPLWSRRTLMSLLMGTAVSAMAFGQTGSRSRVASNTHRKLSHAELKALIANAKTREDHLRLADYYHAEASRLRKDAEEHQDLATAYTKGEVYEASKTGASQHCKQFADFFAHGALEADRLAADHEKLADQLK